MPEYRCENIKKNGRLCGGLFWWVDDSRRICKQCEMENG